MARPTSCSRWQFALVALLSCATRSFSQTSEPAPMVIQPSQYWEGNDGPWSTFPISIGESGNVTRVLVSTLIPNPWVVLSQACSTSDCATSRGGGLFTPNASSTWKDEGLYNLWYEGNLNYTGNGDYGLDNVGLGLAPSNASTANDTLVIGFIQDDFWLGYLGVNPQETNLTNYNHPIDSLIQTLRNNKAIPSLSYSYTAGAQYRNKGTFGQLILGGYDTSRFQSNSLDFNMAQDITRDLVVGIQSLQSTDSTGRTTNLLNEGILSLVDSTVPWIVLPDDSCDLFEQTFGISEDPTSGLYLISDSQHNALTSRNPNFTFVLGNSATGGNSIPITLPYSSFDLTVTQPYVSNGSSRYFPLKRGNDTNYALGRTFLQEAYLTANYEHKNFSISQAVFNTNAQTSIQPVHALGYVAPAGGSSGSSSSSSGSSGIGIGAIVGIVIAAVVIIAVIGILALLRHQRRWPFHGRAPLGSTELDADGNAIGHEKDGVGFLGRRRPGSQKNAHAMNEVAEVDSKSNLHGYYRTELAGTDLKNELPGVAVHRPGSRGELAGSHMAAEIEGSPGFVMELPGSPVGHEYFRGKGENGSSSASQGLSSRSPISPPNGREEISPSNDQLTPSSAIKGRNSRSPISPETPASRGSRAGSTHSEGRR